MKYMKLRRIFITFAVALILTACSTEKQTTGKDTLIIASSADAVTFDIQDTNTQSTTRVATQIYDTLILQNEDLSLAPGLAESWTAIDDTTWEFKLKEGVIFHNGEPFNAESVAYTIKRAIGSGVIGHIVGTIDETKIKIIDDYTIQLGTKTPFGPFITHLSHPATAMLNELAVTEGGEDYGLNPVGTGPYEFVNWISGSEINLTAFDGYHGEAPLTKNLSFRVIKEDSTRLIALETGEIDIALDITPADISKVTANDDLQMLRAPNLSTAYVGFNVASSTPISDAKVRQAINHAIDVESVLATIYQGVGKQAVGPVNSLVFGHNNDLTPYEFDIDKAKALLEEAGYGEGFSFKLYVGDNNPQRISLAEVIKESLLALNINVEIVQLEWAAFLDATAAGEGDMFILGWTTVTTDADYGLYPLFHSSQHGAAGNRSFYTNVEVDRILDEAKSTIDVDTRKKLYEEVQVIIRDDAPWIFIQEGENLVAASKKVKGFINHPIGSFKYRQVSVDE